MPVSRKYSKKPVRKLSKKKSIYSKNKKKYSRSKKARLVGGRRVKDKKKKNKKTRKQRGGVPKVSSSRRQERTEERISMRFTMDNLQFCSNGDEVLKILRDIDRKIACINGTELFYMERDISTYITNITHHLTQDLIDKVRKAIGTPILMSHQSKDFSPGGENEILQFKIKFIGLCNNFRIGSNRPGAFAMVLLNFLVVNYKSLPNTRSGVHLILKVCEIIYTINKSVYDKRDEALHVPIPGPMFEAGISEFGIRLAEEIQDIFDIDNEMLRRKAFDKWYDEIISAANQLFENYKKIFGIIDQIDQIDLTHIREAFMCFVLINVQKKFLLNIKAYCLESLNSWMSELEACLPKRKKKKSVSPPQSVIGTDSEAIGRLKGRLNKERLLDDKPKISAFLASVGLTGL